MTVIHWFRRDLRLTDNTAWQAALRTGEPVIPLFVFDPALLSSQYTGAPRITFMRQALVELDRSLRTQGSALVVRHADPTAIIPQLVAESGARGVYANRDYSPYDRQRDQTLQQALNIPFHILNDALLVAPEAIATQQGTPYKVYTPFKKQWLDHPKPAPDGERISIKAAHTLPAGTMPALRDLGFEPFPRVPPASEAETRRRLDHFVSEPIYQYADRRDLLVDAGTSKLSPYLRFGLLSIREAYHAAQRAQDAAPDDVAAQNVATWIGELAWREFYVHILYHFPHVVHGNFRAQYDTLAWRHAPDELDAWQQGLTGYPVVDAGMRQLNQTGWMHNRARMITASFLTKDLLINWREGERYFMQVLLDGDPAANNGGWQWAAGTGTDAQPYFRIFNPISQGKKYDPAGDYVRQWVTELRVVPDRHLHAPWEMPTPPDDYPAPLIDHASARTRALNAFKSAKKQPHS